MRSSRLFIISLFVGLSLAASVFAFEEPVELPPEGSTSAPILSGPTDDIRYGPLSIEGGITTNGPFASQSEIRTSGDFTVTDNAQICLGGECIDSWNDILSHYVRLSPSDADSGFIHLNGLARFQAAANADFALYSRAVGATAASTYALSGNAWGSVDTDNQSFGVLGIAAHNSDVTGQMAHGIFGWDGGNRNAYAGYFTGRVDITDNSLLCFIDGDLIDCRNTWPLGGPADDLLALQFQWPSDEQSGWTAVNGPGRFTSFVLGNPDGHSASLTCGDGICSEGAVACPTDCPVLSSITAAWQSDTTALVSWTSNTPMTSVVHYGLSDQYGSQELDTATGTSHSITLSGLDKDLSYHYRVGGTTAGSGTAFYSDDYVLPANIDTEAPQVVTSLNYAVHLPPLPPGSDIEKVALSWTHAKNDNPPGSNSGFKEFRVYRKLTTAPGNPVLLGATTNLSYNDNDPALLQTRSYLYWVTAVDNNLNESFHQDQTVHIPKRCTVNLDCALDSGYPNCCSWGEGGKACAVSCGSGGGSSPILNKLPYEPGCGVIGCGAGTE